MLAPFEALASVPDELKSADAAPLLCAGITTFNALRHSGARPRRSGGDSGHRWPGPSGRAVRRQDGLQDGGDRARRREGTAGPQLGAQIYIDSTTQNAAQELGKLGGAKVILATVTDAKSMSSIVGGLGIDGKLLVVGASGEPIEVAPMMLIGGRRSVAGWPSGTAPDSEDTHELQRALERAAHDRDLSAGEGGSRLTRA